jgi:hypothetical protein
MLSLMNAPESGKRGRLDGKVRKCPVAVAVQHVPNEPIACIQANGRGYDVSGLLFEDACPGPYALPSNESRNAAANSLRIVAE